MGVKRYWRYSPKRMAQFIEDGMVIQTSPGAALRREQYLGDGKGVAVQSLSNDTNALTASSGESLGYPTQRPTTLLKRIIATA
jgi:hypothetical protein